MGKIEIKQLKTFAAVYESGSFTRASESLGLSQPAISEQVKSLEKGLGCRLFDRLGRTIRPTRKADLLYLRAQGILEDLLRAEEELAREDERVSGELVIGASNIPGAYLLPALVLRFKEQYPEVFFEIRIADSGEIIDAVLNHDLLIGIVGTRLVSRKLDYAAFMEDELVLAAAASRKISSEITPEELLTLPVILRERGSGSRKSLEDYWLANGLAPDRLQPAAVLGSNTAVKEAVKLDMGLAVLSRLSIREELAWGSLKEIGLEGLGIKRRFYITTMKKKTLPRHYSIFQRYLADQGADWL